jgi:hypothetical protein
MAQSNPLEGPLRHAFSQLNAAFGLLAHLDYQLENYVAAFREKLNGRPAQSSDVYVGTSLLVRDLTEAPYDGVWRRYPSGVFETEGEDYLKAADQIMGRNTSWTIAQGWERFESFLLDITAAFLAEHPDEAEQGKLRAFMSKHTLDPKSSAEWRQFIVAKYRGRNNEDLLGYLRLLAPHLEEGESFNYLNISLSAWYDAVAHVRHAAIHSGDLISKSKYQSLDPARRSILADYFPGSDEPEGYRLHMKVADARKALEMFTYYTFLVFKALSLRQGYNWEILKGIAKSPKAEGSS